MKKSLLILVLTILSVLNGYSQDSLSYARFVQNEMQEFLDSRVVLESKAYLSEGLYYEVAQSNQKEFVLDKRHQKWSISTDTEEISFLVNSTENIVLGSIAFYNNLDSPIDLYCDELAYEKTLSQNYLYWLYWMKNLKHNLLKNNTSVMYLSEMFSCVRK